MQLHLHVRLKPLRGVVVLGHRQRRRGDQLDCQVQRARRRRVRIARSESGRLAHEAAFAGKHALVQHHALVALLPVEGDELDAAAPERRGVGVGGGEAQPEGVHAHQVGAVVREDGGAVRLLEVREHFLGEGEDVVGDQRGRVRERGGRCRREVVRGTVDSERAELARYFGFGLGLVGAFGELFELGVGVGVGA